MFIEDLNREIEAIEKERVELFAKQQPIHARLLETHNLLRGLKEERDKMILASRVGDSLDIELMLCGDPESTAMLREQERQLKSIGLHAGGGYYTATGQKAMEVALIKGNSIHTRKALNGLLLLLPHLKPIDGFKRVGIFEHTLSEDGSYELKIKEDGEVQLVLFRYGTPRTLKTFPSLGEALTYVEEHHYYEESKQYDNA